MQAAVPSAMGEAAAVVGDVQVRNMGTVGGGIAHADPASDAAAAVIALGARLRLRSAQGVRECAADEFFRGPFTTVLEQEELLEEIVVDRPRQGQGSAYRSVKDPASGYALAGAAVRVVRDGDRITRCTVGLTGAGPYPTRLPAAEEVLLGAGEALGPELVRSALAGFRLAGSGDSDGYPRQLVAVAVTRAFVAARARAFGEEAA